MLLLLTSFKYVIIIITYVMQSSITFQFYTLVAIIGPCLFMTITQQYITNQYEYVYIPLLCHINGKPSSITPLSTIMCHSCHWQKVI